MQKEEFKVFYSWQSDLNDAREYIRGILGELFNSIDNKYIIIDEATRNVSGSPSIPSTILEKIESADIFVCDITTINNDTNNRKTPNPNVVFELGYAVAHLGWERIVLLFDTDFGSVDDVPFDFKTHRITSFTTKGGNLKGRKGLLKTAIEAVINDNPDRPTKELSPEEIKRKRDIENLERVLSTLHLPTLHQHISDCPRKVDNKVYGYFWEDFRGVVESPCFHLYDTELSDLFSRFYTSFKETVSYGQHYHLSGSGEFFIFSNPLDAPLNDEQQKDWDAIQSASIEMGNTMDKILSIVREKFLEVDILKTNKTAWSRYIQDKNYLDN